MRTKISVALGLVIFAAVAAGIVFMMTKDSKPPVYEIEDTNLVISCSFGTSVPVKEISELALVESPPQIATKTNGLGLGSIYKGSFKLSDSRAARLFIDTKIPLFIVFKYADTVFYINDTTAEQTKALFDKLSQAQN
jgi:hypothetical protein